jgi:hypothetical protein
MMLEKGGFDNTKTPLPACRFLYRIAFAPAASAARRAFRFEGFYFMAQKIARVAERRENDECDDDCL